MPFGARDIEALKASVPDRFRRVDDAGALSRKFDVDSRRESTALQGSQNLARFDLGQLAATADPDTPTAFILSGAQQSVRNARREQVRHDKDRDANELGFDIFMWALEKRLADLQAELIAIDTRLEEIRLRRLEIGDELEALDELDQLAATGKLDPSNPAHAALLKRAGIPVEDAKRNDITALILGRRKALGIEDTALAGEWNNLMNRRGVVVEEIDDVKAARADIENADTDEARILAERRASTVLGAQQLTEAAASVDDVSAKLLAAEAIGVSAKSEDFNRSIVANSSDFVAQSDELNWDQNEPPKLVMALSLPKP
jgi:hypothetical protein